MIAGPYTTCRPCFLFCGGGTGGHLTPGLSVAEEVRKRFPQSRLVFVGTGREREAEWVHEHGFEFRTLPASPWGPSPWRAARFALRTTGGLFAAMRLLKELRPDAVVGLGGYGALAPGLAAAIRRVPLALMEQNAIPGKANRVLSHWASAVYCAWGAAVPHLKHPERAVVSGNPIRPALRSGLAARAPEKFGLSPAKRTLLVIGGSQGSAAVNAAVCEALLHLDDCAPWLQVLHAAGAVTYERVRQAYDRCRVQHAALPFIRDMASAYATADLVIGRAGGTTLAEITAAGLPALLVPLPIAADDHQTANARILEQAGAAVIIPQERLEPLDLARRVRELMLDEARRDRMAQASRGLGVPEAARTVANRIIHFIQEPAPLIAAHQSWRSQ